MAALEAWKPGKGLGKAAVLRLDWSPAQVLPKAAPSQSCSFRGAVSAWSSPGLCLQCCDSDPLSKWAGDTPGFQCSNSTGLLLNHLTDHPHIPFHFLFHFGTRSLPQPPSSGLQSSHSWDPTASSAVPAPGVWLNPLLSPSTLFFFFLVILLPLSLPLQLRVQLLWELLKAAAFHQL